MVEVERRRTLGVTSSFSKAYREIFPELAFAVWAWPGRVPDHWVLEREHLSSLAGLPHARTQREPGSHDARPPPCFLPFDKRGTDSYARVGRAVSFVLPCGLPRWRPRNRLCGSKTCPARVGLRSEPGPGPARPAASLSPGRTHRC